MSRATTSQRAPHNLIFLSRGEEFGVIAYLC